MVFSLIDKKIIYDNAAGLDLKVKLTKSTFIES